MKRAFMPSDSAWEMVSGSRSLRSVGFTDGAARRRGWDMEDGNWPRSCGELAGRRYLPLRFEVVLVDFVEDLGGDVIGVEAFGSGRRSSG